MLLRAAQYLIGDFLLTVRSVVTHPLIQTLLLTQSIQDNLDRPRSGSDAIAIEHSDPKLTRQIPKGPTGEGYTATHGGSVKHFAVR